jgi:hypothetical protein
MIFVQYFIESMEKKSRVKNAKIMRAAREQVEKLVYIHLDFIWSTWAITQAPICLTAVRTRGDIGAGTK